MHRWPSIVQASIERMWPCDAVASACRPHFFASFLKNDNRSFFGLGHQDAWAMFGISASGVGLVLMIFTM